MPPDAVDPGPRLQFCCAGCRTVHAVLHDGGLEQWYDIAGDDVRPAVVTDRDYRDFDRDAWQQRHVRLAGDDLRTCDLVLEGVHCAACVWVVERLPRLVPGVVSARLDLGRAVATVTWDPAVTSLSRAAGALDRLGHPCHPRRGSDREAVRRAEDRASLGRLAVAGFLAGNVMLISLALYAGLFDGMEPVWRTLFRRLSLVLTVPAVFGPGRVFLRGAWAAVRTRVPHVDLPVSLGILAGFTAGAVNAVTGTGEIWFDTVTMLIFLLLVGRRLEQAQRRRAADAASLQETVTPAVARLVRPGHAPREVSVESVVPGDMVEVRPGERVPVDGRIAGGLSELDLSLLTGESAPRRAEAGDPVWAGTLNLTAVLSVEVEAAGEDTRAGRLMRRVETWSRGRAPVVRMADRLAGVFTVTVLVLAGATVAAWWPLDPSGAVRHATALLIVTCPCALALATPLAVAVGLGRAARDGVLVRDGAVLERLARPGRMWLDKTGTVTRGRPVLVRRTGDENVWPLVRAVEAGDAHPVARALVEALPARPAAGPVRDVRRVIGPGGAGVAGEVRAPSDADADRDVDAADEPAWHRVRVGAPGWIAAAPPTWAIAFVERAALDGLTPILVEVDGRVAAAAALEDPPADGAREALAALQGDGWQLELLSGDHPDVVERTAERLGLPRASAHGGASPEAKAARIQAAAEARSAGAPATAGPRVMVGDGVNDAAALAAADVGVGVRGGAEAALEAADVFVSGGDLGGVVALTRGARRTVSVIRLGMGVSLAYNILFAGLAAAGFIHPLAAAVLMPVSGLTVTAIAAHAWGRNR